MLPLECLGCNWKAPYFLFTWDFRLIRQLIPENTLLNQTLRANDTNVAKSPLKNICGSITIKNILPLINVVFLGSWLSLADHQTRCSINYAWLDLNGFFTGRLGLVIREPAHVEQPCPLGRGITPVERKPTLWHAENRGKHHFLLAHVHLSVQNVPTVWSQKKMSHLLLDYEFPTPFSLLCSKCCQPFDRGTVSFVFTLFNVTYCDFLAHSSSHPWQDISDNKISPSLYEITQMCSSLA